MNQQMGGHARARAQKSEWTWIEGCNIIAVHTNLTIAVQLLMATHAYIDVLSDPTLAF
jgi:hypothetical protein